MVVGDNLWLWPWIRANTLFPGVLRERNRQGEVDVVHDLGEPLDWFSQLAQVLWGAVVRATAGRPCRPR